MNRRSFMSTILALGAAPAIVRADSLMRIVPRGTVLITPEMIAAEHEAWARYADRVCNPPIIEVSRDAITWEEAKAIEGRVLTLPAAARFVRTSVSTMPLVRGVEFNVAAKTLYPKG